MVVSVHVGPLLSLLLSVNGIKELIPLLDIILKWVNVSDYAYHRDMCVCVCSCMHVCVYSAHCTMCYRMKTLWSLLARWPKSVKDGCQIGK